MATVFQSIEEKKKEISKSKEEPPVFKGTESGKPKRYTLVLPAPVYQEIKLIAEKKNSTILDVMKQFIKLGLIADKIEEDPDADLIIKEKGGQEQRLVMI